MLLFLLTYCLCLVLWDEAQLKQNPKLMDCHYCSLTNSPTLELNQYFILKQTKQKNTSITNPGLSNHRENQGSRTGPLTFLQSSFTSLKVHNMTITWQHVRKALFVISAHRFSHNGECFEQLSIYWTNSQTCLCSLCFIFHSFVTNWELLWFIRKL